MGAGLVEATVTKVRVTRPHSDVYVASTARMGSRKSRFAQMGEGYGSRNEMYGIGVTGAFMFSVPD